MKASIHGRVNHTNLPKAKALLPMFEAVVNAHQAIEEAGGKNHSIRIHAERQGSLGALMESYNSFLEQIEKADVRHRLINLKREEREDPLFRELKNGGHNFTRELMKLFEATFDSTHPIHRAVIF